MLRSLQEISYLGPRPWPKCISETAACVWELMYFLSICNHLQIWFLKDMVKRHNGFDSRHTYTNVHRWIDFFFVCVWSLHQSVIECLFAIMGRVPEDLHTRMWWMTSQWGLSLVGNVTKSPTTKTTAYSIISTVCGCMWAHPLFGILWDIFSLILVLWYRFIFVFLLLDVDVFEGQSKEQRWMGWIERLRNNRLNRWTWSTWRKSLYLEGLTFC